MRWDLQVVWACFWITCPSTGVVAEKDGGFLHHHRVGEAEQGPSTGGKKEGCQTWNSAETPYHSRYPTFWSTCRSGWNVALFCVLQGPGYSYFHFRFQNVRELHQPPNKHSSLSKHGPIVKKYQETWDKTLLYPFVMFFPFHLDPQISACQAVDDYQKQTDAQLGQNHIFSRNHLSSHQESFHTLHADMNWPVSSIDSPQLKVFCSFQSVMSDVSWNCCDLDLSTHSSAARQARQARLVAKALKVASTYSSVVERLVWESQRALGRPQAMECHGSSYLATWLQADVLADLDVLCSLARVALTAFGCPKESAIVRNASTMTSVESTQAVHLCSSKVGRVRCAADSSSIDTVNNSVSLFDFKKFDKIEWKSSCAPQFEARTTVLNARFIPKCAASPGKDCVIDGAVHVLVTANSTFEGSGTPRNHENSVCQSRDTVVHLWISLPPQMEKWFRQHLLQSICNPLQLCFSWVCKCHKMNAAKRGPLGWLLGSCLLMLSGAKAKLCCQQCGDASRFVGP